MQTKLFIFLFLAASIIPNLLFAQFTQQGPKLFGAAFNNQGQAVAISADGNTAVVGVYANSNIGGVSVFIRNGNTWTQQGGELVGTGVIGTAIFQGTSVAISADGNTIVEGGYGDNGNAGAVWVFTRSGGVWTQQGSKLVGTGSVGSLVYQGASVAISADGNTFFEGGVGDNGTGAFWIFTRSGGVWTQQGQKLVGTGNSGQSNQGSSLAISSDGNTLIEGGPVDNGNQGACWIFTKSGNTWTQQGAKIISDVNDTPQFGSSVAISSNGNTVVIGGPAYFFNLGSVWVFIRNGSVWSQQGPGFRPYFSNSPIKFGHSVAVTPDGNTLFMGAPGDSGTIGTVFEYTRSGNVWIKQNLKILGNDVMGQAQQGTAIALSSEGTLIETGPNDHNGIGAAWVFHNPTIGISPISGEVPAAFSLFQNYPNPFNPNSKIKFQVAKLSNAKLDVFDVLGREVSTLVNEQLKPGTYEVDFDGSKFASGIYFYNLVTDGFAETKKMILVK